MKKVLKKIFEKKKLRSILKISISEICRTKTIKTNVILSCVKNMRIMGCAREHNCLRVERGLSALLTISLLLVVSLQLIRRVLPIHKVSYFKLKPKGKQ